MKRISRSFDGVHETTSVFLKLHKNSNQKHNLKKCKPEPTKTCTNPEIAEGDLSVDNHGAHREDYRKLNVYLIKYKFGTFLVGVALTLKDERPYNWTDLKAPDDQQPLNVILRKLVRDVLKIL